MKNKNKSRLGGFTLIELLVVVLIIGILAGVALPQYTKAVEKSRMAEAITLVKSLTTAQEVYKMANGNWASDFSMLDISLPNNPSGAYYATKNYEVELHNMDTPIAHIQAQRVGGTMNRRVWIIKYLNSDIPISCLAITGDKEGESFCKTYSQTAIPALESGYSCYAI